MFLIIVDFILRKRFLKTILNNEVAARKMAVRFKHFNIYKTVRMRIKKIAYTILFFLLSSAFTGCFIFSNEGEQLYSKGKYRITKKNLMSYYLASPDLYVKTEKGEVRINLNPYGEKNRMAQEKITSIEIKEITKDSLQIYFFSNDTSYNIKSQKIEINVKKAVDSILSGK